MNKKISIKQIAEELGMSVSTVSRALSNHPRISESTKNKVIEVAERLNYFQALPSQRMVGKMQKYILLMLPVCSRYKYRTFIKNVSFISRKKGYNILVMEYGDDNDHIMESIRYGYSLPICGAIIYLNRDEEVKLAEVNINTIPTVLIGNISMELPYPKLVIDYYMSTYQAVNHLIYSGCKKIIFLAGNQDSYTTQLYRKGFLKATEKLESPDNARILHGNFTSSNLENCLKYCIKENILPDAFILEEGKSAPLFIRLLESFSLPVPSKVKIVSLYDNEHLQYNIPSVTAVFAPVAEISQSAVEILHQQITSDASIQKNSVSVMKPKIVIRSSSLS